MMANQTQHIEIERKFLVTSDAYKALATRHYSIVQGYIAKGNGRTVRVRIRDNQAFLTIKGGLLEGQRLARFEWEKEISVADARELLQLALPGLIEKTRWIVPASGDLFWEIDEFHGRLEGRTLAEIELDHENRSFDIPPFIGEEVTGQPEYYNANM